MRDINLKYLRELLEKNVNITEYLKRKQGVNFNTSKIIEIAYDLQSGSYIEFSENNKLYMETYAEWAAHIIDEYAGRENKTILDAGTGEITTFSYVLTALNNKNIEMIPYCFDISWSRLYVGKYYIRKKFPKHYNSAHVFCSNLLSIPLHSGSIDIVTTFHALEPNGGKEEEILRELLRISKKYLILFEPSYENNSIEGKKRMERLGYIKGLPELINASEVKLIDVIPFDNPLNELNPTHAYIIQIMKKQNIENNFEVHYTIPGTDLSLEFQKDSYYSRDEGISYPIISGIPILKNELEILSTYKDKM